MIEPDNEPRAEALAQFSQLTGAPEIIRIVQRGRERETARFTLELADGTQVRLKNIDVLWSQAELAKAIAVASRKVLRRVKPSDWLDTIAVLFADCIDVEETDGESFEDTVREWLTGYLSAVSSLDVDQNTAAGLGQPFRTENELYVAAGQLAKYIRREFSEAVKLPELRTALTDLGFHRQTVMYQRSGKRASMSYYLLDDAHAFLSPGEQAREEHAET